MTSKTLLMVAIIVVCLFNGSPSAEEKITANGFFADKVILMVDGEPVILSVGEKKKGVTLLATGQDHAVIRVDGKQKTLFLDQAVPKHLIDSKEYKQNSTAKSHIIDIRLLHEAENIATFAVEYFYNESEADRASLSAKTQFHGKITPYWTHTITPLKPGRHTTTITVSMTADAPPRYMSDAVYFDITPVTGTKIIEFVKEWKRATESTEKHGKTRKNSKPFNHRAQRGAQRN